MQTIRLSLAIAFAACGLAFADGKVMPPRDYAGSFEEQSQEAIIIFHGSEKPGEGHEDLILKIRVAADQDLSHFAWVVPFPSEPKTFKEDPALFKELFDYVETRRYSQEKKGRGNFGGEVKSAEPDTATVLSREIVGSYDVAVVREDAAGGLNRWLEAEGYQTLKEAEDVIGFYRDKGYVFACVKVSQAALESGTPAEMHPLRFSFKTGGRDGIYFPMRMTGLQGAPFDVNLYVFYRFWLNDKLSKYGYQHQGFSRNYRDWDTAKCVPNGGKDWANPENDPLLQSLADKVPTVRKLFQKLYPQGRFYLTNIAARGLRPKDVRSRDSDLWLFPYYTNRGFVPYDARAGEPAAVEGATP